MTKRLAYSIAEAAEAIGVSEDTVYRLIQRRSALSACGEARLGPKRFAAETPRHGD